MPAVRITAPAPLVTLDQVKLALRIEHEDEDELLAGFIIPTAVDEVERFTGRALLTQSWRLTLDCWRPVILFPRPPLQAVVSIAYRAPDGSTATLPSTAYLADVDGTPGRVVPRSSWPAIDRGPAAVTILFDAGADDPANVPPVYLAAVLATAGHLYANRETAAGLPDGVKKTLASKRLRWFGDCP